MESTIDTAWCPCSIVVVFPMAVQYYIVNRDHHSNDVHPQVSLDVMDVPPSHATVMMHCHVLVSHNPVPFGALDLCMDTKMMYPHPYYAPYHPPCTLCPVLRLAWVVLVIHNNDRLDY